MKIVFIQPNVGFKGHTWEAIGIGYIIGYLKSKYTDIEFDFYSGFYDKDDTILDACRDDCFVGFTCTSPQYKHALDLSKKIKEMPGNHIIMFGGIHPTVLSTDVIKEPFIDYVVCGEGELSTESIINGEIKSNSIVRSEFIANLDELPFPDRKEIKNERNILQSFNDNGKRITSIVSSRGCPFNCTFCCSHNLWGNIPRLRSAKNVYNEFKEITEEFNLDLIKFSDDTFTINNKRVIEFCNLKLKNEDDTPYGANAHINTMNENMISKLAESNCQEIWYGVESGSQRILKLMNKHTTIDKIKKVFKLTHKYGIKTRAYFLLGTPTETIEDIKLSEKLCDEIQPDIVGFSLLSPFPTNEYYNYNIMKYWDWSTFDEYNNNWVKTNTLTNSDLKDEQQRLIDKYKNQITFRQKEKIDE